METDNIFSLANKTAVITGALGLLGRHHCKALSEAGASIVVTDLNDKECKQFACELGNGSIGIGADITSYESVTTLRDIAMERYGKVDILVNNAAINDKFENPAVEESAFENYPLDAWKKSLDVNITGTFICSQVLGTEMSKVNYGSIINIASTYGVVAPDQSIYKDEAGHQTFYKTAAYPVTKAAVISFTRFLAAYWGNKGIRVNSLTPGGIENGQKDFFIKNYSSRTPLGRMAVPGDFKGALIFLASDASAYMTGANLIIDGGWTTW
jgi:NAD(P)-dependent dehydrogenase (short-subunit alcohol dehydrogenase family)